MINAEGGITVRGKDKYQLITLISKVLPMVWLPRQPADFPGGVNSDSSSASQRRLH
jgi:hypothetical protein